MVSHLDIRLWRHHDVQVKITLTLDDDVANYLKEQIRLLGRTFDQVVNEALRRGMSAGAGEEPARPYRIRLISSGFAPGVDQFRLKDLLEEEDIENYLKKSGRR